MIAEKPTNRNVTITIRYSDLCSLYFYILTY
jgi:hypothetical protein